jgi:hypothetical protein
MPISAEAKAVCALTPHPPQSKTLARSTAALIFLLCLGILNQAWAAAPLVRRSKTIASVLREPLPPEELKLTKTQTEFVITGPTFTYRVEKKTGAINAIRVVREGQEVIAASGPADIQIDQYRLAATVNSCALTILSRRKDKVILQAKGILRDPAIRGPEADYTVVHTFFNDGVVVSEVKLIPRADLRVEKTIAFQLPAQGQFASYIHKRRDEHGGSAARGKLPQSGKPVRLTTPTSCLGVFSPTAALAIFTDGGATHLSRTNLATAIADVTGTNGADVQLSLSQYLIHVAPGDQPYVLKGGEEFRFRVGISVAPNRLTHRRTHDLRMFTWIGDAKFPYPTDEEIVQVAHWGFTLFQMHRLGTTGEPRPPAGELERVIRKVHELGMLFLWEEGADLMFSNAPGVQEMRAKGKWPLWQGFNYGGHYKPRMDAYCDNLATCMASPNGLAEYRLGNINRMLDRFDVDGIYLDDNLAYGNCTLWKEHGHPQPVYDCLIELHEMNWRRRELMRSRQPHTVLVSHCTTAFILPVICDFDTQLYGEGYSFGSVENYWNNYHAPAQSLPAQGMIWPGDDESARCAAAVAYNYDLLTGGGQYTQIDWRLFAKKLPYATGVTDLEALYTRTYNLAQFYFGLYESGPFHFANSVQVFSTTMRLTYASIYQNLVWNDWLIPVANMDGKAQQTSLTFHSPQTLGIAPGKDHLLFDVHNRTAKIFRGDSLNQAFGDISIPGQNLQLYYLRQQPADALFHVWGGKRVSERWDTKRQKLTFEVQGPTGLQDEIFIAGAKHGIQQIVVAGQRADFFFDPAQGLAHGQVTFTAQPLKIEVLCSPDYANGLPEKSVSAGPLILQGGFGSESRR